MPRLRVPNWTSLARSPTPAPPLLKPTLQPPVAAPPPHITVAVHAQRLDLGRLLLLVISANRPEQVPRPRLSGLDGRGGGSSRRGPRIHSPTGQHDHALLRPQLRSSAPLLAPPLPPALPPATAPPILKEAEDSPRGTVPDTRFSSCRDYSVQTSKASRIQALPPPQFRRHCPQRVLSDPGQFFAPLQ